MNPRREAGILLLPLLFLPLLWIAGCGRPDDPWKNVEGGPTRVLVSFPPLYSFAKQVAGPHAKVLCLATTVGPHHYEPTTEDVFKASTADIVLANGLGLDDERITRLVNSAGNSKVKLIRVGKSALDKLNKEPFYAEKTKHDDHWHPAGPDPHVWLGLDEAIAMVQLISQALQEKDPEHKEDFRKRAAAYIQELKKLRHDGEKKLKGKEGIIITTHDSLRYFAKPFDLKIKGNIQIQPGVEADADKLKALVDLCENDRGKRIVITTEPQYPRSNAQTLQKALRQRNLNVVLAEVDTVETADPDALMRDPDNPAEDYYLHVMRRNIANLAGALE
jgi:zinc transport system substrate-binding protein